MAPRYDAAHGLADYQPNRRLASAERTALVAEAAHVVPPIGAGLKYMSLADLACSLDLAQSTDTFGNADKVG
jgi:2-polyprenyl-6-methoxyphenol hydroxylase-like FAD-dependent oxidoreductase